jgi:2-polyprenyl-3-methyl-5-hydroxy-6-metoxy-1,4-benzoquinol methylase
MSAVATASCHHCGGRALTDAAPGQRWRRAGADHRLVRCRGCGGMFTDPLPSQALLDALYGDDFAFAWYRDHYPVKLLDALWRVLQYRRLGLIRAGGRILDFGGGLGYFARALRLCGYDAETRDPMYRAADKGLTRNPFDTIVGHHVLEHARAPGELLDTLRAQLTRDGTLVLAVPNAGSRGYAELGTRWVWSQPPYVHVHHFTAAGLRALAARHGFAVAGEHYFERWDASTLADVTLPALFARSDGGWRNARWRWGRAQLSSLLRLAALALNAVVARPPASRAELLVVLRRADT